MAADRPGRDVVGVLCTEGTPTGDGRMIDTNSLRWTLPLPLRRVREDFGAHNGAVVVGAIERIERMEDGSLAYSGKLFDTVDGRDCYDEMYTRYEASGLKYGISVDLDDVVIEEAEDTMVVKEGRLRGATLCDIPAYDTAYTMLSGQVVAPALVAAAPRQGVPTSWFLNPHLDGPTPLTVTPDGRVYGHAALWNSCHTGYGDMCITAPRSRSGYAYFRTGSVVTAEGTHVPVGHITMGTGHASARMAAAPAADHYDNTGAAVADVAAGEDEFGIWLAGSVREGVTDAQIREMQASAVSGDWRTIDGSLELVAMLSVNVPGFPVPRMRAMVASGEVTSLVASAVFDSEETVEEPSNEMAPEAVLEAVAPVAEEAPEAEAELDAESDPDNIEDQPDAQDAENETPADIENEEFDAKSEIGQVKEMLAQILDALKSLPSEEKDEEPEEPEEAEPIAPVEEPEKDDVEDMLKALDAIVAGDAPNLAKLLADLDAKAG